MRDNVIVKALKLSDCFNRPWIPAFAALISVGFLLHIYFFTFFNGDANIIEELKSIQYKHQDMTIEKADTKILAANTNNIKNASISYLNNTSPLKSLKKKEKVILYWNSYFEDKDWAQGFGHKPFLRCEYKNCITTNDKKRLSESDALLCHMRSPGCAIDQLPKMRMPHQYWIYFLMESQMNSKSGEKLKPYNGVFNLTVTFKSDSDLVGTYSGKNAMIRAVKNNDYKFPKGNKSSIAWVVSNCVTHDAVHGRMAYIDELGKYFGVKRYGRCAGHIACGKHCYVMAGKEHMFYFAAENSLCKEYLSEKPWNALSQGMIPIVYGLGNYSEALPPHSYIDVRDFKSPRLLADHLKRIIANETLYNSYFKWREFYRTLPSSSTLDIYTCKICAFLNQPHSKKSIVHDLDKKWSAAIDCISPHAFNKDIMQNV